MGAHIAVRTAATADAAILADLAEGDKARGEEYFNKCLAEQAGGRRLVFIVSLDGEDCGYGMLNFNPQYSLYRKLSIPEIQDLYVASDYRGRGAASALIAACEEWARERGCEQIGISVGLTANFGAAQRLYCKLGFCPDGLGVTYDRETVRAGEVRPVDDSLCLMLVKDF